VTRADRGRGSRRLGDRLPATDALITTEPGITLVVFGADCGLVLLRAPGGQGIGVVHAGWRGLAAGVIPTAVAALGEATGSPPSQLYAGVAPAIGVCCYEVGPEVQEALALTPGGLQQAFSERSGNLHLDIGQACVLQLAAAGVRKSGIATSGLCTSCRRDLFYSARGDGEPTGRFALLAMLHEPSASADQDPGVYPCRS
jgi:YfiH family protein